VTRTAGLIPRGSREPNEFEAERFGFLQGAKLYRFRSYCIGKPQLLSGVFRQENATFRNHRRLYIYCETGLAFVVAKHGVRDEAAVVFLMGAVEACLDDAMAERVEVWHLEGLELAREEFTPLARALFVDVKAALDLFLDAKKDAGNHGAFDFELTGYVAEEREQRFIHLLAAKARAAAAG